MTDIVPGDMVGRLEYGDYCYYTVLGTEKGKLICTSADEDEGFSIKLDPAKVDHYPAVQVSEDKIRAFFRYEKPFFEIFGDVYPYERLCCEKKLEVSGEDLLAAFLKYKENGFEKAEKEWARPLGAVFGNLFVFENDGTFSEPVQGYRYLPHDGEFFLSLLDEAVWTNECETGEPDIDKLIEKTEKTLRMIALPVPERDYGDDIKSQYVGALDNDCARKTATDEEIALWVRYVDELCAKDNLTALFAKAYSLYGGNRAYECDWCGSRDLLIKLSGIDDDPFIYNTLGYIYYYGRCTGGEPEYEKAFECFNVGAAGGVYESRYKLSDMYRHGHGVKKNLKIASRIIRELYHENLEIFENGHTDCKFADVALRMGDLSREGVGMDEPDPDGAYYYYLQADFAIKQRLRDCDMYGDQSVAAGIRQAISEILPKTGYSKPRFTLHPWELSRFLSSAFDMHRRVEAKIKKLKNSRYSLRFRILPKKREKYQPRFFVTVPEAHFCGFMDHITVKVENVNSFLVNGKEYDGGEATVVFDEAGYFDYSLYGENVLIFTGEYTLIFPSEKKGKTYSFVSVTFSEGGKRYDYLCDIPDVNVGDEVVVPTRDGEVSVRVVNVFERSGSETTLPPSKYKSVIKKA